MQGERSDGAHPLAISLVVSTIGRSEALRRLISTSAQEAQDGVNSELVVVDQEAEQRCPGVLRAADPPFPWRHLTSGRGASLGRNVGLAAASGPVIGFPDDNTWFTGHTFRAVLDAFASRPALGIVCGRQLTADGRPSMLRWAPTARLVTKANHHRTSIARTMFVRGEALEGIPWFDEDLGVGTATWYGACEESDLLLRAMYAGAAAWYDPKIVVFQDDPRDEPTPEFRIKMLRYGCGRGRLWRLHHLPAVHVAGLLGRKVVKIFQLLAHGNVEGARAELAWVRGALCGLMDRPPRRFTRKPSTTCGMGDAVPGPGAGRSGVDGPLRGEGRAPGELPTLEAT